MDIITSHNALDFDGLASMVAAGKLYPGAIKVFSGTLSNNVKRFLALYKDSLVIRAPREIPLERVTRMIIVDTANVSRLGHLQQLCREREPEYYIYDHHPPVDDDLRGTVHEVHRLGACTTILVEHIIERGIKLTPFEATILALGIYDDTGSLIYPSTTPRDLKAAAFLLEQGANLQNIANFMEKFFSAEQSRILQELLEHTQRFRIKNIEVCIAVHEGDEFIPGLDLVSFRLFGMEDCDVLFVVALMEGKVNAVGRSRVAEVRVNEVLSVLGGRGHEKAASVVVKKQTCQQVKEAILESLEQVVHPAVVAREIMSTPVKSIPPSHTMEDAGRLMLRYGHTGMPVVENGKLVGVISRRDVDKANYHDLGHAPVKGFMTSTVKSVTVDTPVSDVQKMMVDLDVGRLPVTEDDRLVGIISRTDILRILHGDDAPEDHQILYSDSYGQVENYGLQMKYQLPGVLFNILTTAGHIADEFGFKLYCVGGFVRDLIMEVKNFDIDMVVEGDGVMLARELGEQLGGKVRVHERFRTAVVSLPGGYKIDVATARTEFYEFPAALPMVERSSIREDMYRRDFTINALALQLNADHFGELIDYFGGRRDIESRYIRILYNLSFIEDPTRILRAVRFEQRYQFTIEPDTLRFAIDAIDRRLLGKLSYKRIITELKLILNEADPVPALFRLRDIGVWKYILPEVKLEKLDPDTLRRIPVLLSWWQTMFMGKPIQPWLVYMQFIFSALSADEVEAVLERYALERGSRHIIMESHRVPELLERLAAEPEIKPSRIHQLLLGMDNENLCYLLLRLQDVEQWLRIERYLEARDQARLEINGRDIKALGIKPGPQYRSIMDELHDLKLDGVIIGRDDEIRQLKAWIEEGRIETE